MTLNEENRILRLLLASAYSSLHHAANVYREVCQGDSICGMCAYDNPAGSTYTECPGFYKDDCFRWYLSDEVSAFIPIEEDKNE